MKSIFLLGLFVTMSFIIDSPGVFQSRKEARAAIENDQYKTASGWIIKKGDQLKLGRGSMPDRKFAFILEESNYVLDEDHHKHHREMLHHSYSGRVVEVSNFVIAGNRKTGFRILAKVKVGQIVRYLVDIETAIDAGELVMPESPVQVSAPVNDADPMLLFKILLL